ncbi:hypothetical protein [Cyclobacterium roseum]|nr:hypothetical protein [Cyclobacterium roseum]
MSGMGGVKGIQLYDHHTDPNEYINLAGHPDYQEIKNNLKQRLHAKFSN